MICCFLFGSQFSAMTVSHCGNPYSLERFGDPSAIRRIKVRPNRCLRRIECPLRRFSCGMRPTRKGPASSTRASPRFDMQRVSATALARAEDVEALASHHARRRFHRGIRSVARVFRNSADLYRPPDRDPDVLWRTSNAARNQNARPTCPNAAHGSTLSSVGERLVARFCAIRRR